VRPFLSFIVLALIAVAAAISVRFDPGNVVLFYPPYRIDLSLNLFAILAIVLFFLIYSLVRVARKTMQMPQRVAEYRERQAERRGHRALRQAMQAYFEGRFGQAERQAQGAQEWPETAALASLVAARAAHRMTEYGRRDEWLRRADVTESMRAARLMTEAECLVDARDSTRALDAVTRLQAGGARHIQALRLALRANQYAGEWDEVLRILRILDKRDAIHPIAAREIKILAYRALLAARQTDRYALIAFWQDVPASDRPIPEVALSAARAFNNAELGYQARLVIEGALAAEWDSRLIDAYAVCVEERATAQIDRAERWRVDHPRDAHLNYVLGVLCARERLWGKARHYFEEALSDTNESHLIAQIHLGMAEISDAIGETESAAEQYRLAALTGLSHPA
jgi:HemY protein